MSVAPPLWAEACAAASHKGQSCSAKGAGCRRLHREVAAGGRVLLPSLSRVRQMDGQERVAGADLQPRCSRPGTAGTSTTQGALSRDVVCSWGKGWLASCPCPRRIVTECCWIRSREVTLRVWPSGTGFEPDLMIKCDIIPAFRLTQLTGMPLRFPLFGGVKHFCCKPSKRRYCLRVEQKRLWKICQESACALLVPKHGRA